MINKRATFEDARPAVAGLQRIDAVCDRFEAAWRDGQPPELESYLAEGTPEIRIPLFGDLLRIELEYRRQRGDQQPDLGTYQERFPEFVDVIGAAFDSQGDWVDGAWRPDPIDGSANPTLAASPDSPGSEGGYDQTGAPHGLKPAGYEIYGELGRGGMGIVYKARQIALNRDVALKVIRSGGFASPGDVVRFQNEAEAVARLDHPHIVPIYDVGHHRGLHFFSMKLVAGTGLDKRIEQFAADPRAAAALVAVAAGAVHHAHQRGILHRDLKPANILLDALDQPHVTDFGLAKRIDSGHEMTHSGTLAGTPSYMAPEQATPALGALSTATDVYGLGSILYATLSGRAPFAGTTLVETLDMVRTQAPEPPSLLNPRVPRDLEIICLKCLEKEPRRRYQSALELADDLNRWLDGLPIQARPVGSLVRAGMWCRRNKPLAVAAALVVMALAGGLASLISRWRAVEHAYKQNQTVIELLNDRLLSQASPERDPLAKNLTVAELLDRASYGIGGWLDDEPEIEAKIRETMGSAYLALGQYDKAELHLKKAISLDTELRGFHDRDTLRATNLLASLLDQTGHRDQAEPLIVRNLEDCRRYLGPDDRLTLDAAERHGALLWHLGKLDQAETALRKNVDDRRRSLKAEHPDTLRSVYLLSRVLRDRGRLADALTLADQYAHSVQCSMGNHPDNVLALTNQGDILRAQGKLSEAEPYYRRAVADARRILGDDHRHTLDVVTTHAGLLEKLGRPPAAP